MRLLLFALLTLLAIGYWSIGLAWADLESPQANSFAMVAVACVLLCLGLGAAMAGYSERLR